MIEKFQFLLPKTTETAAGAFVVSLDAQIRELEEQLKLLRAIRSGIAHTFSDASTGATSGANHG